MFNLRNKVLLLLLIALSCLLAMPSLAAAAESGQAIRFPVEDTIIVQRENGTLLTVDNVGEMTLGWRNGRIVIDVIHAGVVRETGELVNLRLTTLGTIQREGSQAWGNGGGLMTVTRENGNQVEIDITASYSFSLQPNNLVVYNLSGTGSVQGSGENIVIDVIGAGLLPQG